MWTGEIGKWRKCRKQKMEEEIQIRSNEKGGRGRRKDEWENI